MTYTTVSDGDLATPAYMNTLLSGLLGVEAYNVKDAAYGAAGDAATDDYAAIQAAIDAAFAAGGGTVYIPPGTYWLSQPLELPPAESANQVRLQGAGMNVSTLKRTTNTTSGLASKTAPRTGGTDVMDVDAILIFNHADSDDHARTEVRDLKLDGLGASPNTYGIYAPRLHRSNLQNIFIQNVEDAVFGYQVFASTINNVRCQTVGRGLVINRDSTGTGGATSLVVNGFSVNASTYSAYHLENLLYSFFNGCTADDINSNAAATYTDNEDAGTKNAAVWYFDNCRQITLNSCANEATTGPVIYSAGANSHLTFNGFFTTTEVTGISGVGMLHLDGGYYDFNGCRFGAFGTANSAINEVYANSPSVRWINSIRPSGGTAPTVGSGTNILIDADGSRSHQVLNGNKVTQVGYKAVTDGATTSLFTITSPDSIGGYSVKVKTSIRTQTASSDMACRYEEVAFSRIRPNAGTSAALSTVVAMGSPTSATSGGASRDVDAPTITVVDTSDTVATIQINVTGAGSSNFFVAWEAEVLTVRGADADWLPVIAAV